MKKSLLILVVFMCFALYACGDMEDTGDGNTPFANSIVEAVCEKARQEGKTDGACRE